jgi:hypothetical protein
MQHYDPYSLMLEALNELMDNQTDEQIWQGFELSQQYVKELREAYQNSPCRVDYSSPEKRAAYLLAYYPHYVEPLYHVLTELPFGTLQSLDIDVLRACFVGAGPSPEVLGYLYYLERFCPSVATVKVSLLDKFINDWRVGQDITRYNLAPIYAPNKRLIMSPLPFDLVASEVSCSGRVDRALRRSDLLVMQNAINDQLHLPHQLLKNLIMIFEHVRRGCLFVIIDLSFEGIRQFMIQFEQEIVSLGIGESLLSPQNSRLIESKIHVPQIILDALLVGSDKLVPRKYTKFYSLVLVRV